MDEPNHASHLSRRDFVGYSAAMATLPLVPSLVPRTHLGRQAGKPNSKFNGVQIGTITYSFREMPSTAEDLLKYLQQCGISTIELMGDPAEQFAGAPAFDGPRWPGPGQQLTDEQRAQFRAAREAHARAVSEWRTSASMSRFEELRRLYNDAGIDIHIVKFSDIGLGMSEDEVNYCFNVAKTLGATAITTELSEEKAAFLAPYAAEHRITIAFHNHTQVNPSSWEGPLSHGEYLGINLDVGHYVAGTNQSPLPIIERYGDARRIVNLHIKDRKVNDGPNMPFGQGDTPVALILQLMKRKGYTFPADIELEYQAPEGSNPVAEVRRCLEFCRTALADPPESDRMGPR
jgi:sugar phosphate isomerase/epimerase